MVATISAICMNGSAGPGTGWDVGSEPLDWNRSLMLMMTMMMMIILILLLFQPKQADQIVRVFLVEQLMTHITVMR